MSAIFGFFGPPDDGLCTTMSETLKHRGRSTPAVFAQPQCTLAFQGHEPADGTPAFECGGLYADGADALAVAGQIFAFTSQGGARPAAKTLLEAFKQEGEQFLTRLRGTFAMAIWCGGALHLIRDGAGARPLFYGVQQSRLLFAIEQKAILADGGIPREIRPASVAQYLTFGFVPDGFTMLRDVRHVPAGHIVSVHTGGPETPRRWFHFENGLDASGEFSGHAGDAQDWVTRTRRVIGEAVRERLPETSPVGVLLSGGIDSSIVTAEVARQASGRVKTWSIHFGESYPNELQYSRAVARQYGTDHEEILIDGAKLIDILPKVVSHLDDPIGDPITAPNFVAASLTARSVQHLFNGEGGDPLFGGPKNIGMLLLHWYGGATQAAGFRERAYLASFKRAYDELDLLLTPEFRRQIEPAEDLERVITPFFGTETPPAFLNKLMAMNIRLKAASMILPKVDRMYGAWGVTPLMPLFDERLMRLSFAMPPVMKLLHGVEKRVLKLAYAGDLPQEVVDRPKSGMRVPVHYWFQGGLKTLAQDILSPDELRKAGIFNPARVKQLLDYEAGQAGRFGLKIWMLLTFELWRRAVLERKPL